MNQRAFNTLLEIGYSISDYPGLEIDKTLSFVFLSKDGEPDVCIFVDAEECKEICKILEIFSDEETQKDCLREKTN